MDSDKAEATAAPSLTDRITPAAPTDTKIDTQPPFSTSNTHTWADEMATPVATDQIDGATQAFQGSSLEEPDYAVDVKLSDMQEDPNNPLYSVKSFDQLGL